MPARRTGFTLLELLVVIAILGVLMALGVAGYFAATEGQRQSGTEAGMRTARITLEHHSNAIIAEAKDEAPSATARLLAGNDEERARIIWIKLRLVEAFPQSFADITNPLVYQVPPLAGATQPYIPFGRRKNIAAYAAKLARERLSPGNTLAATESSACLLLALSQARGGFKFGADEARGAGSLRDTDSDGMNEIVDGWGTPLVFFRFPTGNPDLYVNNGGRDPLDPKNSLQSPTWSSTFKSEFARVIHPLPGPRYIAPVLVSCGRDLQHGLNADMSVAASQADDNIYSFYLRLGAKGN